MDFILYVVFNVHGDVSVFNRISTVIILLLLTIFLRLGYVFSCAVIVWTVVLGTYAVHPIVIDGRRTIFIWLWWPIYSAETILRVFFFYFFFITFDGEKTQCPWRIRTSLFRKIPCASPIFLLYFFDNIFVPPTRYVRNNFDDLSLFTIYIYIYILASHSFTIHFKIDNLVESVWNILETIIIRLSIH